MTQEVLKQMYQLLLTEPHAPTVCAQLERIAREALAEHAMKETQRLGQEIEQEPFACERCKQLEEQAYDLVGELRVANIKLSMRPQRLKEKNCG